MNINSFFKENADKVVLIDFWAPWCRYCVLLNPVLDELEEKFKNKLAILKINVDDHPEIAQEQNVLSLPTLKFFKNGNEIDADTSDRSLANFSKIVSDNL